jgi:alpha-beta hydrolase superfamily lysophospholipase
MDRDENMPGQRLDVFNTLAHHLAAHGIASLRYDKRGCGQSGGSFGSAGHHDHVADADAGLRYLEDCEFALADRLYLIGHSEGTIIAAQLALRHPELAGIVLLSPFLEPMETILMKQAAHLAEAARGLKGFNGWLTRRSLGDAVRSQRELIAMVRASEVATLRIRSEKVNARWLRELLSLDPPAIYQQVAVPMLLISGGKDVQCDPGDAQRIATLSRVAAQAHRLPELTHVLRNAPGPSVPSMLEYAPLLKHSLDREVLDLITRWVVNRRTPGA